MPKLIPFLAGKLPILLILISITCLLLITIPRPQAHGLDFATIHTSRVTVTVGRDTFTGLPDLYDYSKHKDWYTIYLWNYCSGKLVNGRRELEFCSQKGEVLYKLFNAWKYWGVSVRREGGVGFTWLGQGPRMLGIGYVVASGVGGLAICAAVAEGAGLRVRNVAVGVTCGFALANLAVSILAQVTYGLLVSRADDDDINITADSGRLVYTLSWASTALVFAALVIMTVRIRKRDKKAVEMKRGVAEGEYKIISGPIEQEKDSDVAHLLGATGPQSKQPSVERVYEPYRGRRDRPGRELLDVSRDHSREYSRDRSRDPSREPSPYRDSMLGA